MKENTKGSKNNATMESLVHDKLNFNLLFEQTDNFKEAQALNNNIYYVSKYSENSEEYTHKYKKNNST